MNPVAFEIFGLSIRWYGIFMATAILIGSLIVLKGGKKLGYEENDLIDLMLWCVPSGIIGARLYYVAFERQHYQGDILKIINIRSGGMAIHGAVIGGVLAGYIFCKRRKIDFWRLIDLAAPAIILGQAIGRWGNYTNQEAHGGPTDLPWGIVVDGTKVHPTFLYESIWNLMVFALLLLYSRKKKVNGEVFGMYMIFYSIGRFFIEGLRTDSLMFLGLRTAQMISLALIILGFVLIVRRRKTEKI